MSKKYIKQIDSYNFIYPNNTVAEYDLEIIHTVNDNAPLGTITSATITGATATGMTLNWEGTWDLNDAEPFVDASGDVTTFSIHGMGPTQQYFKPFRLLAQYITTSGTPYLVYSNRHLVLTPAEFGLSSFTDGTYYFEFRAVSKLAIAPICASISVSGITPPPTATPTPTATTTPTPTPTITPSGPTPTPTPSPTVTAYTLYYADEYACTFPGCALQQLDVVVALPSTHTPNYGKFYPDEAASGFAYLLTTTASTGPGIILNIANFTACSSACAV